MQHCTSILCGLVLLNAASIAHSFAPAGMPYSFQTFAKQVQPRCFVGKSLLAGRVPVSTTLCSRLRMSIGAPSAKILKDGERWQKFTKQIATVGPACSSSEMLEKLFLAGIDIFRLNFSHGEHSEKAEVVKRIRELETKFRHPIAILADLQGPKLRVGTFRDGGADIKDGQAFRFDLNTDEPGDAHRVSMPHPEIIHTLKPGDVLLVDDGKLRFTVTAAAPTHADCVADVGGRISNRKGVNTPSIVLPISPLTPKDRIDLEAAFAMGADWVALSFVQRPEDMHELRRLAAGRPAGLLAKLEKPAALAALPAVVAAADACMVARGDLGVECPPEDVPGLQRRILDACRAAGRPAVVATQMLESMIESPVPTRAEVGDVAAAGYDAADAVMLSAETASGRFPQESAAVQRRVLSRVQEAPYYFDQLSPRQTIGVDPEYRDYDAAVGAAAGLARQLGARAVVVVTRTGAAAARAARLRPAVPVVALTPSAGVARRLVLYWGVRPAVMDPAYQGSVEEMLAGAAQAAAETGVGGGPGDVIVVTARVDAGGRLSAEPGPPNLIRVIPVASQ